MSGFVKTYRKMKDSAIWDMPPEYLKIWTWLLLSVNHREKRIPNRDGSFTTIYPGQLATSYRQIAEQTGHYERLSRKTQNPKTVKSILEFMEKQGMISVLGNTNGTIVTIINWGVYQAGDDNQSNTGETQKNTKSNTENVSLTEINTNEYDCDGDDKVTLGTHSVHTEVTLGKHSLDTNKNAKNVQEVQNTKKSKPKESNQAGDTPAPPAVVLSFPQNLDSQEFKTAWDEWEKYRREIKHSLKPTTRNMQLKKLSAWGIEKAIAAIELSITQGWTGLFDPDEKRGSFRKSTPHHRDPVDIAGTGELSF